MGSARDFLKQITSQAHRQLDETILVASLIKGDLSRHGYRTMLEGYQAFFSPWEKAMRDRHPEIIGELGSFRFVKSEWIVEDLDRLAEASPPIPLVTMMPPADRAGLAGCLYVIEGSTLGGMHLSRAGHVFPENAGRFFQGYGPATMEAWKAFIAWLEATLTSETDQIRAAETACLTFQWFQRKFSESSPQEISP